MMLRVRAESAPSTIDLWDAGRVSLLTSYLRQLIRQWFSLAAGAVLGGAALIMSATDVSAPAWVWICISAVLVVVAGFLVYRDATQADRDRKIRTELLRTEVELIDETFHPLELIAQDSTPPVVNGRRFVRCTIKGPAVIKLLNSHIDGCALGFGQPPDGWFWVTEPGVPVFGVVGFLNCRFERCTFSTQVAFSTTPAEHGHFLRTVPHLSVAPARAAGRPKKPDINSPDTTSPAEPSSDA